MPRNPDKAHCLVPGCHNGAMRGHTHDRSHRGAELGPAPPRPPQTSAPSKPASTFTPLTALLLLPVGPTQP
jgi:hypothetical protein